MMKNKIITILALLAALPTMAQTHLFGFGSSRLLDTYLSQENFSGAGLTYLHIRESSKPEKHWGNVIEHEADFAAGEDRNSSVRMLELDYNLYWGRYRQWTLIDRPSAKSSARTRLRLQAGGLINGNIGVSNIALNTNNPYQARVALNLMPSGIATYDFPLFRKQFTLRYELNVPLAGVRFSPNFGQSYYEIFGRGDYDHNVIATTFVSTPTLRQQLTLEWHTGKKWNIRVGYLGNYRQAAVNNLKQHIYADRLLIGINRNL